MTTDVKTADPVAKQNDKIDLELYVDTFQPCPNDGEVATAFYYKVSG